MGMGVLLFGAIAITRDLATVREYAAAGGTRGDRRVMASGMVASGATVRSPGGTDGAAWITWLTHGSGKKKTTPCVLAHVADLPVEGMGRLDFVTQQQPVVLATNTLRGELDDPIPAVLLGESKAPKDPAAVAKACANQLAAKGIPADQTVAWEQVLSAGSTVHVMGCRSPDSTRIVPCGNGYDLVSIWPIEHHASEHRSNGRIFGVLGVGVSLPFLLAIGFSALAGAGKRKSRPGPRS